MSKLDEVLDDYQLITFHYHGMSEDYYQIIEVSDTTRYVVCFDPNSYHISIKAQVRMEKRRVFGDGPESKYHWKSVVHQSMSIDVNSIPGIVKAIQKIVKFLPLK
jgi:hypothetical protein